ncbi:Adenylate-forming enzyme [Streptococcus sp. DD11]|uniref:F390 synthetase-related protein n=1 Tax=Streptococcus sp. DD11 TaxID=1777879 RepID=UPI0007910DF6|nr:F390 synthetase-related protein [Streptococcus sp. DD11]KXT84969.1 Adenylate-forming enzyme [Streptococcus sp. DD11]
MQAGTFLKTFIEMRWLRRFDSRQALEAYQTRQLAAYRAFLQEKSPYFRQGIPADFRMDKALMMRHFNQLNTVGMDRDEALELALESERTRDFSPMKGEIAVGLSSGTSGHRGLFITSEQERSMWAAAVLAKMLPPGKLLGHRIAFFLRADNALYQTVHSALIRLQYFDTFQAAEQHLELLNAYQPSILVAPASMLLELAKLRQSGRLNIAPQKVISVAEILEEADRQAMEAAFELDRIDQIYQATEGFLACSCACGQLHLNEDIVFVEKNYLDEGRFYPLITDFKRRSQPIYRYELNDILVENPDPCPCGSVFTRIDRIEGRSDDIFVFENAAGEPVEVFPDFIRRCLLFVDGIGEYQAAQLSSRQLVIAIEHRSREREAALTRQFQQLAADKDFLAPQLIFKDYQRDRSRKLKRICRI